VRTLSSWTLLVTLIALISLAACASKFPDQNKDPAKNNQATFRKDLKECQENYPEVSSGGHLRQWQGCLALKGWQ
jgi:predicted small lipoprotein YifL